MGDALQTVKPFRYLTGTNTNSAYHFSGVCKSSSLLVCLAVVKAGRGHIMSGGSSN